jgi:glycogen synthase
MLPRMRVWHLSWEYPPVVFGGLGRHVHALAEAQAQAGNTVTVITLREDPRPHAQIVPAAATEVINDVFVERIDLPPPAIPFDLDHLLEWVMSMQAAMSQRARDLVHSSGVLPDIIHAHDWLVAECALELGSSLAIPVIATMHATERGRHQGWLHTPLSREIDTIEADLARSASHIITCSHHMATEVASAFGVDQSRISVIANGADFRIEAIPEDALHRLRQELGVGRDPLLVFCGRLEWEKGADTLIASLPAIRDRFPETQIAIAGEGSQREAWQHLAREANIAPYVHFTGWLPDSTLHALISTADVLVIPSLYEPFGVIALEGAALGTPLVVADTGGLAEFVHHGVTGLHFPPGDKDALTTAVVQVLSDPELAERMTKAAFETLQMHYNWDDLSDITIKVYQDTAGERRGPN